MKNCTDLLDGKQKSLLHVAPEYEISNRLKKADFLDYWTSSFDGKNTRAKIDITKISFPDDHFDTIYCSHVLEHVTEDRKAIREFWRILKPGRWALLQVAGHTWVDNYIGGCGSCGSEGPRKIVWSMGPRQSLWLGLSRPSTGGWF